MTAPPPLSRREFLTQGTLAVSALALSRPAPSLAQTAASRRWPMVVFSKAFQELSFEATADLVAEVGWDGIECPVRKGGQVVPERVEDDLPRLVEVFKQRGLGLHLITTDVRNVTDRNTEKVLRVASKLGIKLYRLGGAKYRADQPIADQLKEIRAQLRDVAALNQELGLCAGFQNHSGNPNVGAAVWDIYDLIKDLNPLHLGVFFDIGHATVEGGLIWPTHARLMESYFRSVYVKDFIWQKGLKGASPQWCPLGEGTVQRVFFDWLKKTAFRGPISQHFEYPIGTGPERIKVMKQDLARLKSWLA